MKALEQNFRHCRQRGSAAGVDQITELKMHFETKAIHVGQESDPTTGAVVPPIYQVSTFRLPDPSEAGEFVYARVSNPTTVALERAVAALEEGEHGMAFASGMAATTAAMSLVHAGEHVLITDNVYGGNFRLVHEYLSRYGVAYDFVDMSDLAATEAAIRPNTRLLWAETPTNPLLKVVDIACIAELAHRRGAWLGVDNTFASPYFQTPLALGADIVMHSCTKYLGGHSDLMAGILVTNDELYEPLFGARRTTGGILGPFDAWLLLRGVKTLAVRMEAHQRNGFAVARFLEGHPRVARVFYPGLESHPEHALAARQMRGFSGMVTIEIAGGHERARKFVQALRLFTSAVSLGGVESLVEIPHDMTHEAMQGTTMSISPAMVRLSVGLEHADDLIADLEQALAIA
jgi:cystathionine beta-lyase/cystathionine gamma-synthase